VVDNVRIATLNDVKIMGEDASHEVARELNQIISEMPEPSLVVNLGNVKFMASAMIGKLVLVRNQCQGRNIKFSLCSMNEHVANAIGLVRLDSIVELFDDEASAVKAMCDGTST
jgi:anti-anti-sigma factor